MIISISIMIIILQSFMKLLCLQIIRTMVEGPGCKLKGEKLKSTTVGQRIVNVAGNIIEKRPKKDQDKETPYHKLKGHVITDVRTLGKELFLFLDYELCLRIHFLMAGYVRFNDQQSDPDEGARKTQPERPRLELQLNKDLVSFYLCSVELRDGKETMERWENMISLDVCWNMFDAVRSADKIMEKENSERMVVDVVMDQEIMPGVGNIIKNEGCFDAGINPLTKIKDLTREHVVFLVKMLRDFSMIFYNCRKTGKPLHKFYKMYRFSKCKQCNGKVTKCKPGEYERGTYFCPVCQDNSLRSGPRKNSLLGWAQSGTSWTCQHCTLVNKPGCVKCSVCGADKLTKQSSKSESNSSNPSLTVPVNNKRKSSESFENFETESKKQKVTLKTTKSVGNFTFTFKSTKESTETKESTILRPSNSIEDNSDKSNNKTAVKEEVPELCKGHKKPCVKKTVSKEGPNKLRLFWTCSLPKAKSCNHFSWADLHHPKCKHGNISLLREVYKMNENNGREFFICPKPKKDQCDFFQWNDNNN